MSRLRWSEWLAAAGAIALVVCMFAADWHGGADPRTGWQALPVLRWLVLVTAGVVLATVAAQTRTGPALSVALDVVSLVLAAVTVLALLIALLTTSASLCPGAYAGLAAAIAMLVGVFASLRIEGGWRPGPERPIEVVSLPADVGGGVD